MKPISIWTPEKIEDDIYFVRPDPLPLGDHYATRKKFKLNKQKGFKRICFFGESAAAGYLLAPYMTNALVLESQLNAFSEKPVWEVLDFSMTNETLEGMAEKIEASFQLTPDMIIIFTGNNWTLLEAQEISPYFSSKSIRQSIGKAFINRDLSEVADLGARRVFEKAVYWMEKIAGQLHNVQLPAIVVVPEVNLADWEVKQPLHLVDSPMIKIWYEQLYEAIRFLKREEYKAATEAALKMMKIDDATCPTTFRIIYHAQKGLGKYKKAREAATAAVDCIHYTTQGFLQAPQIGSMNKMYLRKYAVANNYGLVDLPKIFSTYSKSSIPDRKLFLDYCHMTEEGMNLAMGAVALSILKVFSLKGYKLSLPEFLSKLTPQHIPKEKLSEVLFGTAIHIAHRMPEILIKRELLEYYCDQAIDTSENVIELMENFICIRSGSTPSLLSKVHSRGDSFDPRLKMAHGWDYDYLDVDLVKILLPKLRKYIRNNPPFSRDVNNENNPVSTYLKDPLEQIFTCLQPKHLVDQKAFFRAVWPETEIILINPQNDKYKNVEVAFHLRLPPLFYLESMEYPVWISVNDDLFDEYSITTKWQEFSFQIPSFWLDANINILRINWPFDTSTTNIGQETCINNLLSGRESDLFPIFGEISNYSYNFK